MGVGIAIAGAVIGIAGAVTSAVGQAKAGKAQEEAADAQAEAAIKAGEQAISQRTDVFEETQRTQVSTYAFAGTSGSSGTAVSRAEQDEDRFRRDVKSIREQAELGATAFQAQGDAARISGNFGAVSSVLGGIGGAATTLFPGGSFLGGGGGAAPTTPRPSGVTQPRTFGQGPGI